MNGDNVIYFGSFEVEYITKEVKKFIGSKNVTTIIYRMQAYDSTIRKDTFKLHLLNIC